MQVREVRYTRVFNVGPYEKEEYCLLATLEEDSGKTARECIDSLRKEVLSSHKAVSMDAAAASPVKEAPKTRGKKAAKAEVVEEEAEEVEEEAVAPKAARKTKAKTSNYSRSNETHKAMFAEALNANFPKWKKTDAAKAKAKKLSQDLDGTEFLDADGEILESFMDAMAEGME